MSTHRLFFDGHCGLCHRSVRFTLAKDRNHRFRFAPLGGAAFEAEMPEAFKANLPDSLVLMPAGGGTPLMHSSGIVFLLKELGGVWRGLGFLLGLVPRGIRDAGYRCVARIRHRLFARPADVCPMMTPEQRERFDP